MSLFARLLHSVRPLQSTRLPPTQAVKFAFERPTPFWTRWWFVAAFVGTDVALCTSIVPLTWQHWTRPEKNQDGSETYVLRPKWQRVAMANVQAATGLVLASTLLLARARMVHRIYVLPTAQATTSNAAPARPGGARLFVQCAHHRPMRGYLLPLSQTTLERTRIPSEVALHLLPQQRALYLGLDEARIGGQPRSVKQASEELFRAWGVKGEKIIRESKWTSGPLARRQ